MQVTIEVEGTSIVVAGDFNPAIFSPYWLASVDIIDKNEAADANVTVIHPDLAAFQTSWFEITVERERCTINTVNGAPIRVFDFMMRLFGDILPQTPVRALGINYVAHFRVKSLRVLNRLGDTLAPKTPWGEWGSTLDQPPPKDHPQFQVGGEVRAGGLRSIVMSNYVRPDGLAGFVQTKIESSVLYRPAVYIEVNDHFQIGKNGTATPAVTAMNIVDGRFDDSSQRSRSITEHFMKMTESFGYEE